MTVVLAKRHLAKALTWRVIATGATILIAWIVSGDWRVGAQVGFIEFFAKMGLYYAHERAWYRYSQFGIANPD